MSRRGSTIHFVVLIVGISAGSTLSSNCNGNALAYTFFDIGNLGAWPSSAFDVNDRGIVVGYSQKDSSTVHAVMWHNGSLSDLDMGYDRGEFWGAVAISNNDVIFGLGSPDRALILIEGAVLPMDIPDDCEDNESPLNINNSGTIASGSCYRPNNINRPTIYYVDDQSAVNLGPLPGAPNGGEGYAYGINDNGVAVGWFSYPEGRRSFIWADGVMTELLNTLGGTAVNAYAINNSNLVVGSAELTDGCFVGMTYDMDTGIMSILGDTTAIDVNERGWAVGGEIIDLSSEHAILYKDGEVIDLHDFIEPNLVSSDATAINNYGWVTGCGTDTSGNTHGWLLVPEYGKGDFDGDEDVDLQDFGHFQRCFAAEPYINGTLHVGCSVFDFDDDVDLDLTDYEAFQVAFTGPE